MPFFFSGMWMLPMMFMPLMAGLMVFFLYKKGFFDAVFETFNSQNGSFNYEKDKLIKQGNNSSALEIVNRRYAEGDLSTEEYRELKRELRN